MSKTVTDLATTAQEQFFEALEGVQDAVLEGVKLWRSALVTAIPDELVKSVPLPKAEWLPTPAAALGVGFDFAEKLFAQQRRFAEQVLAETTTAVAKPATPLVTVPPKAAAAGK